MAKERASTFLRQRPHEEKDEVFGAQAQNAAGWHQASGAGRPAEPDSALHIALEEVFGANPIVNPQVFLDTGRSCAATTFGKLRPVSILICPDMMLCLVLVDAMLLFMTSGRKQRVLQMHLLLDKPLLEALCLRLVQQGLVVLQPQMLILQVSLTKHVCIALVCWYSQT